MQTVCIGFDPIKGLSLQGMNASLHIVLKKSLMCWLTLCNMLNALWQAVSVRVIRTRASPRRCGAEATCFCSFQPHFITPGLQCGCDRPAECLGDVQKMSTAKKNTNEV